MMLIDGRQNAYIKKGEIQMTLKIVEHTKYRDIAEVEKFCCEFLREEYGIELAIPIERNNRLSRALGRFRIRNGRSLILSFAGFFLDNGTEEQIVSTMKHECIHYALFEQGRNYKDGDADFENQLRKHSSCPTGTQNVKREQKVHLYSCGCHVFKRRRRLNNKKTYSCSTCEKIVNYVKTELVFE